jgi:hypothetical protein
MKTKMWCLLTESLRRRHCNPRVCGKSSYLGCPDRCLALVSHPSITSVPRVLPNPAVPPNATRTFHPMNTVTHPSLPFHRPRNQEPIPFKQEKQPVSQGSWPRGVCDSPLAFCPVANLHRKPPSSNRQPTEKINDKTARLQDRHGEGTDDEVSRSFASPNYSALHTTKLVDKRCRTLATGSELFCHLDIASFFVLHSPLSFRFFGPLLLPIHLYAQSSPQVPSQYQETPQPSRCRAPPRRWVSPPGRGCRYSGAVGYRREMGCRGPHTHFGRRRCGQRCGVCRRSPGM